MYNLNLFEIGSNTSVQCVYNFSSNISTSGSLISCSHTRTFLKGRSYPTVPCAFQTYPDLASLVFERCRTKVTEARDAEKSGGGGDEVTMDYEFIDDTFVIQKEGPGWERKKVSRELSPVLALYALIIACMWPIFHTWIGGANIQKCTYIICFLSLLVKRIEDLSFYHCTDRF